MSDVHTLTEFEWDDTKAEVNIARHGVSFRYATRVFLDPEMVAVASIREEDGEERFKAIGSIDGKLYVAVYVMRGTTCRLISARRTNAKEDERYGNR
jgi:hypothetical protein